MRCVSYTYNNYLCVSHGVFIQNSTHKTSTPDCAVPYYSFSKDLIAISVKTRKTYEFFFFFNCIKCLKLFINVVKVTMNLNKYSKM